MKKSFLLSLFCLFLPFGFQISAQEKIWNQFEKVDWKPVFTSIGINGESQKYLNCTGCGISNENSRIPVLPVFIPGKEVSSARLKNAKWLDVPFWELPALDTQAIKSENSFALIEPAERKKQKGSLV
jgi:hypothetical protein